MIIQLKMIHCISAFGFSPLVDRSPRAQVEVFQEGNDQDRGNYWTSNIEFFYSS
jgi:hypothetical protein